MARSSEGKHPGLPGMSGAVDLARQERPVTSRITRLSNTRASIFTHHTPDGQPTAHELHLVDQVEHHTYIFSFLERNRAAIIDVLIQAGVPITPAEDNGASY